MIEYKINWLQWPGLSIRKVNYKSTQVCPKYKKYTKMISPAWRVLIYKTHLWNVKARQSHVKSVRLGYEINSQVSHIVF